ncbi:hypothetical protein IE4803_PC00111 (plasmid) [Rhizobium etli bv. phaseoli str. IE4803]|nr:hypothetical protein IE4803_PC00111 [Rhizobium etli bv. phaseoli str. IE4803]
MGGSGSYHRLSVCLMLDPAALDPLASLRRCGLLKGSVSPYRLPDVSHSGQPPDLKLSDFP